MATVSNIGKLEPVDLRELWKHEEYEFSAWLEKNLDTLSQAIGVSLSEPRREVRAGNFQVDLVTEDEYNELVVIENQLSPTDHDHLGKLLTYLTNMDAKTAIWISPAPRPEHIRTVQWLNETTPDDIAFFLVRLAAYRIGSSEPAPLFTVIVGPSTESKAIGDNKKEFAARHVLRLKFWEQLLSLAKQKGVLTHAQRTPSKENWISAGAGYRSGVSFTYLIFMTDGGAVELYIDTGDKDENKEIFDKLSAKKAEIEQAFGDSLSWERLDDRRASRIRYVVKGVGLVDEAEWPTIQDAMVNAMDRLAKALRPHLERRED